MKPMLFETADADNLGPFIASERHVFQQKLNGVRVFMRVIDGVPTALGRDGQPKANPVPKAILDQFRTVNGTWHFDGELVDGVLWLFDIGRHSDPYSYRLSCLERFVNELWRPDPCVRVVPTKHTPDEKRAFVAALREIGAEGLMVKHVDAEYRPGPKRSREILKAKFWHDVDAIVSGLRIEGKDNFEVKLIGDDGTRVRVGTCAMKDKLRHAVKVGSIVTVRYLYIDTGELVQPSLERVRDDKPWGECTIDQLHYTDKHTIHS